MALRVLQPHLNNVPPKFYVPCVLYYVSAPEWASKGTIRLSQVNHNPAMLPTELLRYAV